MAMPTMHILQDGLPLLPSGMFYPRAIVQLYLMAGSVALFGESEWAMRLPSVLCGLLLVVLSYGAGRRFLSPVWSLALAACVALLPEFIVDAQTARMYTFLVSCVAGYLILLFKWEQTDRIGYLIGAVAVMLLGLQFHSLAIFAALVCLFPGLAQGDLRKLVLGCITLGVIVAGFVAIDAAVGAAYPQQTADLGDVALGIAGPQAGHAIPQLGALWVALAGVVAAGIATILVRVPRTRVGGVPGVRAAVASGALIALGLLAQFAFSYHLAALLLVAGWVVAWRNGGLRSWRLGALLAIVTAIAALQLLMLRANGVDSMRQAIGALTGWPSIWPYLVIGRYSVAALLLSVAAVFAAPLLIANRRRIPDHVLFAALAVWVPLFMIGFFLWNIPFRYAAAQAFPLLLAAFAAAQWFASSASKARWQALIAVAVCLLVVNPVALARTVNSGYATHPDHKGAAEFIKAAQLGPRDVVIAEDVLQQTYYLGHVDYWLVGKHVAAPFVIESNGEVRDFYTNTKRLGSGEALKQIIDRTDRGDLYIVGSGEDQADGRRFQRSYGIWEVLESPHLQVVYRGRDGLTKVWKVPAGVRAAAVSH
jgi:4-amino-4-deoxy-L-arabinose transferase-like glycosyltransferase